MAAINDLISQIQDETLRNRIQEEVSKMAKQKKFGLVFEEDMQRFFGFEQYIRAGAQKTIEIIRNLDIVDSLEKFVAFENKSKLTNAKKLLKAKNSPVLQMKKNDLLENLKKHSRYKTMFKFEEDHIVISSQKEAAAFIKMLNDDIVRSELTGKEYDSSSKMLLAPMGSSQ